ncbi:MAG TPA: SIS domain-containing protein [Planctomycetota bacterium]|nr:SIS domain-containing protein [Planctomycetota bacterium]
MLNLVSTDYVRQYLARLEALLKSIDPKQVSRVGELLTAARAEGRQVFLCGNGGSAALASHLAVDLGKGCSRNRDKRFRVISLTDNVPWMTAVSNDISYEDVFVEQLKNYAVKGDILIAISGSGNSKNVLKAVQYANQVGCETVGISGFAGGKLKELVKDHVHIKSEHMGLIEDGQQIVGHTLVYAFMDAEGCG